MRKALTISMAPLFLLVLVYAAFISLGLPDSVLGLAWPTMRAGLKLPLEALGVLTLIQTLASALSGFASGWVMAKLRTGPLVLLSCLLTGGALLGVSLVPSFPWLLAMALPLGFGAGSVDASLNHFVAEHYSSRHMNWLHGFWGIGATLGPIVMAGAISGSGWRNGYRIIGLVQLSLALVFLLSLGLWRREDSLPQTNAEAEGSRPAPGSTPAWAAWLGPGLYLVYAAVETGMGLWAASVMVGGRGISQALTGIAMSAFYGSIMGGRFFTGILAEKLGNRTLVRWGLVVASCGAGLFSLAGLAGLAPAFSVGGLALLGLGCAPVYPCLMHETPRRFDKDTARLVVSRQVAVAYIGAALIPPLYGLVAAKVGLESVGPVVLGAALLLLFLSEVLNRATPAPRMAL